MRPIKNGFNICNLLRLDFPDSKHLDSEFFSVIRKYFLDSPPPPQLYMLATALTSPQ